MAAMSMTLGEVVHVAAQEVVAGWQRTSAPRPTGRGRRARKPSRSSALAASSMARVIGGVRRAAAGRVVLEAAVGRRVVRRRHHDAVGERVRVLAVPGQDGVRDGRRRA